MDNDTMIDTSSIPTTTTNGVTPPAPVTSIDVSYERTPEEQVIDAINLVARAIEKLAKRLPSAPPSPKEEKKAAERAQREASRERAKAKKPAPRRGNYTDEQMQCRYTNGKKQRCGLKSRGPRFRFMCEKHTGKVPATK